MNSVSKLAHRAALALAVAASTTVAAPVTAQAPVAPLTQAERVTLLALKTAFNSGNMAAASASIAATRAAATGAVARHSVAEYDYQIALRTNNYRAQTDALTALIAGGRVPASQVPAIHEQIGSVAYNHIRDYGLAERAFAAQVAAAPNSAQAMINLAKVKIDLKRPQEAQPLLVRAIQAQSASGQRAPEHWYKVALDLAYRSKNAGQVAAIGPAFVTAYPSPENWRDVLLMQRELQAVDQASSLDLYRLMRASRALAGETDYFEMAAALDAAGFASEARAVLEEGAAARMIDTGRGRGKDLLARSTARSGQEKAGLAGLEARAQSDATGTTALKAADTLFGRGEHAKAAEFYRTALQKGSVDTGLANMRLGMALALAGQKAEAEAAFSAAAGPNSQIAAYWLAFLGQRA